MCVRVEKTQDKLTGVCVQMLSPDAPADVMTATFDTVSPWRLNTSALCVCLCVSVNGWSPNSCQRADFYFDMNSLDWKITAVTLTLSFLG